jgi:hypothetical protein
MLRNRVFRKQENPSRTNYDCDALYCDEFAARFRQVYTAHEDALVEAFGCPPTQPITEEKLRPIIGEWGSLYREAA